MTLVSGIDPTANAGGTRSYVLGLAQRLRDRNISVALVARDGVQSPLSGVEYVRIQSGQSSVRFLIRLIALAPGLRIPRDSIIHVQRPDDLVAFAAKVRNPKVCTLHGIPPQAIRRRKGLAYALLYGALERAALGRTNRIIAVDERTATWYAGRYPWLARRTVVVPIAVDTDRFQPQDRATARDRLGVRSDYVIAYAGRLSVEKRVDEIIRALRFVPQTELLVAGEGPEEPRLRELARGLPVRFLGPVPHERMAGVLAASDILVLASEYEGMPTIALEAFACGRPIVATPVGGLPDVIVPGETGWLVPDLRALGAVLRDALPKASSLERNCTAAAAPYRWDVVVDRILAVYEEAAA